MNDELKEKLKLKIAISQIKNEEEKAMNIKGNFIIKNIGIAACVLISMTGVVFAGSKIVENIWKIPEKIENPTIQITEESKKENITEEQAKEIAIKKLKEFGFTTNNIETWHYKDIETNEITYRFISDNEYEISIKGHSGDLFEISNYTNWREHSEIIKKENKPVMTVDEAREKAIEYCKLFGVNVDEYEVTKVDTDNKNGDNNTPAYRFDFTFSKKYGEIYNPYERIIISVEAKNKKFLNFRIECRLPFDNNEIIITQDEAIQIALKEDAKIETNTIIETKVKKMIVKTNSEAYERINDKAKYYQEIYSNNPNEERNYYKVENRIRNAWVVVITYKDNYGGETAKRYTEGKYSYFVDCTTGEIIGGHTMDYTDSI